MTEECLKLFPLFFLSYLGMYIGGDYQFSLVNFLGLNISVLGSLIYTKGWCLTRNHLYK